MPGHSWENNYRKLQCCFCSHFSWLILHVHSHMLLSVSLLSRLQNLFFPASQLVIWRVGKRKSRRTSIATQHQGRLLHDQREWNQERWENIIFSLWSQTLTVLQLFNSLIVLLHMDQSKTRKRTHWKGKGTQCSLPVFTSQCWQQG